MAPLTSDNSPDQATPTTLPARGSSEAVVAGSSGLPQHSQTEDGVAQQPTLAGTITAQIVPLVNDDKARSQAEDEAGAANADGISTRSPGLKPVDEDAISSDSQSEDDLKDATLNEVGYKSLAPVLKIRMKKATKRSLQATSYIALVEDRLKEIEKRLQKMDSERSRSRSRSPHSSLKETGPSCVADIALMNWGEFIAPKPKGKQPDYCAIDILIEPPHSLGVDSSIPYQPDANAESRLIERPRADVTIERIRINSILLEDCIEILSGSERDKRSSLWGRSHLKPFKALLAYEPLFRAGVKELDVKLSKGTVDANTTNQADTQTVAEADMMSMFNRSMESVYQEIISKVQDDQQTEVGRGTKEDFLGHLKCLVRFIEKYLEDDLSKYRQLRLRSLTTAAENRVSFDQLWYLFAPGDILYDPANNQALRVLATRGGRTLITKKSVRMSDIARRRRYGINSDSEDDKQRALIVPEDRLSPFGITCFAMDYNGKEIGPVQTDVDISPFMGHRPINALKVYPIEYADLQPYQYGVGQPPKSPMEEQPTSFHRDKPNEVVNGAARQQDSSQTPGKAQRYDGQTIKDKLLARGKKFAKLANTTEVAHKDYDGFSLGKVREQIDSQVIVDLELFYQKRPEEVPKMGLKEPPEGPWREVEERYTDSMHVTQRAFELKGRTYDDRKVDRILTDKFMADHQHLLRYTGRKEELLSDDYWLLFPRQIWAFVLRNRTWSVLDVEKISDLTPRRQGFNDLVLPQEHKDIVEGLVKTHSKGPKPVRGAEGDADAERHDDLVRGKGKGLIVLLHGVPGVGKTSTAECVAEYTGRPLFALTCGDIGDTAQDVQTNLSENFLLAHRWGCVMLLDEADVFLQTRDKQDMRRNAVVSVFLRILEYYSGILFLTTNKVGSFDEAFKSRIHISLYYKPLTQRSSKQIWKVNLRRIQETRPHIVFDEKVLLRWVKDAWQENKDLGLRPWNGRQIHNACQTATALAEFQNKNHLTPEQLKAVEKASREFDKYLEMTHGTDDYGRASRVQDRGDDRYEQFLRTPTPTPEPVTSRPRTSKKSSGKHKRRASPSSSASDQDDSEEDSD